MKTLRLVAPEPTEAELQAALMRRLTARGWLAVRINSGAFKTAHGHFFRSYIIAGMPTLGKTGKGGLGASAGFPDVLALKGDPTTGEIIARLFELKKRSEKCSEAQERFADFAQARGVGVEVVAGLCDLEKLTL